MLLYDWLVCLVGEACCWLAHWSPGLLAGLCALVKTMGNIKLYHNPPAMFLGAAYFASEEIFIYSKSDVTFW